jgi:hypothetical protein
MPFTRTETLLRSVSAGEDYVMQQDGTGDLNETVVQDLHGIQHRLCCRVGRNLGCCCV